MLRMSRRGIMGLGGCSLAAVFCLAALASASSAVSSASTARKVAANTSCPVNVLLVGNLSGAGAANGQADLGTAKATIAGINKTGGVLGCAIKLKVLDDGSDYTKDVPITEQALSSGTKYSMIMETDYGCAETTAIVTRAKTLELTACGLAGPSNPQQNPTIFDLLMTGDKVGAAMAKYMVSQGCRKIAVVTDNTSLGTGEYNAMASTVGGSKIVDHEGLNLAGVNFTPAILHARASNPDCLYFDVFGAAAGHFLNNLKTSGWSVKTYFGPSVADTNLQQLGVPASQISPMRGINFRAGAYPSDPAVQSLLNELKRDGVNVNLDALAYTGTHDALVLFAWAANQTKSLNGTTMANKLATSGSVTIPGLAQGATTGFTTACHQFRSELAILKGGYFNESRLPFVTTVPVPNLPCPKAAT